MPINGRRPFTELFESIATELVRESASNQEAKYMGYVNQIYSNELPSLLPETYIRKEAFVTLAAEYTTGTVTVGSGTSLIQGASTTFTSAHTNYWIKVDGFDRLYRVTFSDGTLLTSANSLSWIGGTGSGLSYSLFQDRYQLASDFAYMVEDDPHDPNVVSRYVSGSQLFLDPKDNDEFERDFHGIIGDVWAYTVKWILETPYLVTLSAPSAADILRYWYIPQLTTLTEYTTGTVTFTTGTQVTGSGSSWVANVDTSANIYFIRNDADGTGSASKWARILSVTTNTHITLSAAFGHTSGAGITYTISEISKWPARFDDAIFYKAALIADPDNAQIEKWKGLYSEAISLDKTVESKRSKVTTLKQFFGMRGK